MIIIKVEWGTRGGGTMSDTQLLFFSWKLDKWLILTPSLILEKDLCGVELQRVNSIFVEQFSIVQIIIVIDDRAASVHHYIRIPGPANSRPHHLSHPTLSLSGGYFKVLNCSKLLFWEQSERFQHILQWLKLNLIYKSGSQRKIYGPKIAIQCINNKLHLVDLFVAFV